MISSLLLAKRNSSLRSLFNFILASFALNDLGPLHFFLGIHVTRTTNGFFLNQSKYAKDLPVKFSMDKVKTCPTPRVQNVHLSATEEEPMKDPTAYRSAIYRSTSISHVPIYLSFSVNSCSALLICIGKP